jgi:hypothetical protein
MRKIDLCSFFYMPAYILRLALLAQDDGESLYIYNEIFIFFKDIRLEKYTFEHCECRAKRGARRE